MNPAKRFFFHLGRNGRAQVKERKNGPTVAHDQEKEESALQQRSLDHSLSFHLIVLLQENDEKKKDDQL